MKGAAEYADVMNREAVRYKKLYIEFSDHARGKTLHIWVLDSDTVQFRLTSDVVELRSVHCYPNAVEVYGVINGNPGWTEEYGWKIPGPWQKDFADFIADRREKKRIKEEEFAKHKSEELARVTDHQKKILDAY